MRTERKKKWVWIRRVLILSLLWISTFCRVLVKAEPGDKTPTPGSLYAYASCLYDAASGRVLFEKNATEQLPMASTTKIMTLLVILENAAMEEVVTVSSNAARQPDVQLNINTGEQYYLKDLLYSLMLESHNDVAVALAEHVGESVEGFCGMMNEKAAELGLTNTCFETPNGLDSENHYTTAVELAKIAAYALKNEEFVRITNTSSYQFNELTRGRSFTVSNKNRFLYMMDGAIGMKTGFTGKAGYCFVGALRRDGYELVSVVLACGWPPNKEYKWSDTRKLMNYGLEYFHPEKLLARSEISVNGQILKQSEEWKNYSNARSYLKALLPTDITVTNGAKERLAVEMTELSFLEELLLAEWEMAEIRMEYPEMLRAPVTKGTVLGTLTIVIGNEVRSITEIYAAETVEKKNLAYCIREILKNWSCAREVLKE